MESKQLNSNWSMPCSGHRTFSWTKAIHLTLTALIAVALPSFAQSSLEKVAGAESADVVHAAQNPIAHLISIPFQNDTNFDVGPYHRAQDVLLVEPVVPFRLTDEWIVITRSITPLIYQPQVSPAESARFGLGNVQPQFYLSPSHSGKVIWGVGPQLWLPTATDRTLGVNKWGGGPAAVALTIQGHWLAGVLASNVWAGGGDRKINQMSVNPFAFYNMPGGWYVVSSPVITAQWHAKSDDRWLVPVGGGVGRVFKIGSQPINARFQFWDYVNRPEYAPSWTLQLQVQLLFPG